MSSIDSIVANYNSLRAKFMEEASNAMRSAFTEFFQCNPNVEAVKWAQYTPYFNDGDECIFGTRDMDLKVVGGENFIASWYVPEGLEHLRGEINATKSFQQELAQLPDEVFKDVFGDHAEVTATRDGFQVDEYEHE